MEFDILDTYDLVAVRDDLEPVSTYWLDLCFPNLHQSQSDKIIFEDIDRSKRLAPFVMPNVQGQPMINRGTSIQAFSPAYLKPKNALDINQMIRRRVGGPIGGPRNDLAARRDALIAQTLADHEEMITRREEWMACEAIVKGQVTVYGENYPSVTIAFGRNPANTKTLTTTRRWTVANAATSTPITDIQGWALEMQRRSGRILTRITLTPAAVQGLYASQQVQRMLETRRGSTLTLETARVDGQNVLSLGTLPGTGVELYQYFETYENNQGEEVPYVADGTIVLTGDVQGYRAYGAIMDDDANYAPLTRFPSMWKQKDPSGIFMMTQSAPLMIPLRTDATMSVNVADALT